MDIIHSIMHSPWVEFLLIFILAVIVNIVIPSYLAGKIGSWVVKKYFPSWKQISVSFFLYTGSWKAFFVALIIIEILGHLGIYGALMGQPVLAGLIMGIDYLWISVFFVVSFADFLLESYLQSNKGFGQV